MLTLPSSVVALYRRAFYDAQATRFLSAVGTVAMLYDHLLTLEDEHLLVWRAPPSFAKYAFLYNRYSAVVFLTTLQYFLNAGSFGSTLQDRTCQTVIFLATILGVCSIITGNTLVLLRVVSLWERDKRIFRILFCGLVLAAISTLTLNIYTAAVLVPSMFFEPVIGMCYMPKKIVTVSLAWASPMIFEVLVIIAVCWNAIDRPRSAGTNLTRALYRDGLMFFASLTIFRIFNVVMFSVARPTLMFVGCFFVWSMNTLVLNRSLLNIQKAAASMHEPSGSLSVSDCDDAIPSRPPSKIASSAASLSYSISGSSSRSLGGTYDNMNMYEMDGPLKDLDYDEASTSAIVPQLRQGRNSLNSIQEESKHADSPYKFGDLAEGDSFLWVGEDGFPRSDSQTMVSGIVSAASSRIRNALSHSRNGSGNSERSRRSGISGGNKLRKSQIRGGDADADIEMEEPKTSSMSGMSRVSMSMARTPPHLHEHDS